MLVHQRACWEGGRSGRRRRLGTAMSPSFCAASTTPRRPPRSVLPILSRSRRPPTCARPGLRWQFPSSDWGDAIVGRLPPPGSDLADLDQATPKLPCTRPASPRTTAVKNAASAIAWIDDSRILQLRAEVDVDGLSPQRLGQSSNGYATRANARRHGLFRRSNNTICENWRSSAFQLRRRARVFPGILAENFRTICRCSAGGIATKAYLRRYSGARNRVCDRRK